MYTTRNIQFSITNVSFNLASVYVTKVRDGPNRETTALYGDMVRQKYMLTYLKQVSVTGFSAEHCTNRLSGNLKHFILL